MLDGQLRIMRRLLSIFLVAALLQRSRALSLGGGASAQGQTDVNAGLGLSGLGNLLSNVGLNLGGSANGKTPTQGKGSTQSQLGLSANVDGDYDSYAGGEGEAEVGLSGSNGGGVQTQGGTQGGLSVGGGSGVSSRPTYNNRPTGQTSANLDLSLQTGGSTGSYRPERPSYQSDQTQGGAQGGLYVGGPGQSKGQGQGQLGASRPTYNYRPTGQTGTNAGLSLQTGGSAGQYRPQRPAYQSGQTQGGAQAGLSLGGGSNGNVNAQGNGQVGAGGAGRPSGGAGGRGSAQGGLGLGLGASASGGGLLGLGILGL